MQRDDETITAEDQARLTNWIADALEYADGLYTPDDVWQEIHEGAAQLLYCDEGMVVTQIRQTPQKRYLLVWLAAGTMQGMRYLAPLVEQFAQSAGCALMQFHGRPGWERTFLTRDDGWQPRLVTFTKELV